MERMIECLPPLHEAVQDRSGITTDRTYQLVCTRDPRFEPRDYVLRANKNPVLMSRNSEEVLDFFEAHVDRYLARRSEALVFVRGGAVLCGSGAFVIPGTRCGTTTLVQALLKRGAAYLADDLTALDSQGRLHPYPRRLKVRCDDGTRKRVRADGATEGRSMEPVSVAGIIDTTYRPGANWSPIELTRGQCVLTLLENAVCVRERTEEAFRTLSKACSGIRGLRSERGEADGLAGQLLKDFGAHQLSLGSA